MDGKTRRREHSQSRNSQDFALGFRVWGLGLGFRVEGFRSQGLHFLGFRAWGFQGGQEGVGGFCQPKHCVGGCFTIWSLKWPRGFQDPRKASEPTPTKKKTSNHARNAPCNNTESALHLIPTITLY